MSKLYTYLTAFLLSILLFSSCTGERKIVKQFVEVRDTISIMLLPPDYLYLANSKVDGDQYDSAAIANSKFIKYVNDSAVLSDVINDMIDEFDRYGITVYLDFQMDEFMLIEGKAFILDMVQLEMEEYFMPYRDEEYFFDELYFVNVDLHTVSINSWFELNELNHQKELNEVLFASHYVFDEMRGHFYNSPFSTKVKYESNVDSLTIEKVDALIDFVGEKYASYVFDYILNTHLVKTLPEGVDPLYYYHYNLEKDRIEDAQNERFIIQQKED